MIISTTQENVSLTFWRKFFLIYRHPALFFKNVKTEKFDRALIMLLVSQVISLSLSNFMYVYNLGYVKTNVLFLDYLLLSLLESISFILLIVLFSAVLWIVSILFKGKHSLAENYKIAGYSLVPASTFSFALGSEWLIFLYVFFSLIYSFIIMINGIKEYHGFSLRKSVMIYLVTVIIFAVGLIMLNLSLYIS